MKRQIALAVFLGCFSFTARAQTAAPEPYPDPQCKKPQVNMVRPPTDRNNRVDVLTRNDSEEVNRYNSKIKQFNSDAAAYNDCLHAYIDKANGDVKIVQDKANAELKQITERANASMKAIQDKIRQAIVDGNSVSAALERDTAKLKK